MKKIGNHFREELADHPDLAEHEGRIRKEATIERILKFAEEGNREKFSEELQGLKLTPAEDKLLADEALKQFHWSSCKQAQRAAGNADPESSFRVAVHYRQLNPQDGIEAALARVTTALTEVTMDCFRRALTSDALPVRDLGLSYAMRGALVLSALAKAYDSHREGILKAQREERSRGS